MVALGLSVHSHPVFFYDYELPNLREIPAFFVSIACSSHLQNLSNHSETLAGILNSYHNFMRAWINLHACKITQLIRKSNTTIAQMNSDHILENITKIIHLHKFWRLRQ